MQRVVVEPAAYAISEGPDSEPPASEFRQFYASFCRLEKFVKINDVRLVCSGEVYRRAQSLFPYEALATDGQTEKGLPRLVVQQLTIFLDRVATPFGEWEGRDDDVTDIQPRVDPLPALYCDSELSDAWRDLLAGCATGVETLPLMLVSPPRSFAPDGTTSVDVVGLKRTYKSIAAFYLDGPRSAANDFLNVEAYEQLQAGCLGSVGKPEIVYEDSGHQPSAPMKRALEQTANEHRDLVSRMNTTRIIGKSQPCKVQIPAEDSGGLVSHNQLEFTISDGNLTYRGFFTTRATTPAQLEVAQVLVSRTYKKRCERAHLKLA